MLFDTHAHYDDDQFDGDRETLLASLPEQGVGLPLPPCLCRRGHPSGKLRRFPPGGPGRHPRSGPGGQGGGHRRDRPGLLLAGKSPRPLQQQVLRSQLALARELSLPVIIHDRDAHADTMAIVREFPGLRGVFHCFAGSVEMARELVAMGWYLSFNGAATFKNARKAPEVIRAVPMDQLMIETDAPYLTPVPYRGRRNDSTYVRLVAEKIAQLRDMTPQEVEQATWENGCRFFGIPAHI